MHTQKKVRSNAMQMVCRWYGHVEFKFDQVSNRAQSHTARSTVNSQEAEEETGTDRRQWQGQMAREETDAGRRQEKRPICAHARVDTQMRQA
jgi:hypothetical protein